MSSSRRATEGKLFYLALNRSGSRGSVQPAPDDLFALEDLLRAAKEQIPMRILAYCLTPENWQMVLWPFQDGDFARFIGWLTTAHAERWPQDHEPGGAWNPDRPRFECTVLEPASVLFMCRHVERGALSARLVNRAEDWKFGSLWWRQAGNQERGDALISAGPTRLPADWIEQVNRPQSAAEFETIRRRLGRPQRAGAR